MIWQDIALSIVSIVLSASMIPQVWAGFKEKIGNIKPLTSIPTFLGLYVMCGVYITLNLYFSSAITFVTATLWLLLYIQRLLYHKT